MKSIKNKILFHDLLTSCSSCAYTDPTRSARNAHNHTTKIWREDHEKWVKCLVACTVVTAMLLSGVGALASGGKKSFLSLPSGGNRSCPMALSAR